MIDNININLDSSASELVDSARATKSYDSPELFAMGNATELVQSYYPVNYANDGDWAYYVYKW